MSTITIPALLVPSIAEAAYDRFDIAVSEVEGVSKRKGTGGDVAFDGLCEPLAEMDAHRALIEAMGAISPCAAIELDASHLPALTIVVRDAREAVAERLEWGAEVGKPHLWLALRRAVLDRLAAPLVTLGSLTPTREAMIDG